MISLHWVDLLSLAEASHNVHLPFGLAVVRLPYTAKSSHPRKCSDSEHFMLLLWLLFCFVLFLTFPSLCVVLWIGLLDDVLSSNLRNLICPVSNIFWIALGIVCLLTNGISCPLLWFVQVVFCRCTPPPLWRCQFVVVSKIVYSDVRCFSCHDV